jgi:FMN phosphatase YigB (HAD superfamily)
VPITAGHTTAQQRRLLSCDVFDTVLTRRVGGTSGLFLILGQRLARKGLLRSSGEVFARARHEANRRARANAGRGVGIEDIYAELQFSLHLTDPQRDRLKDEELRLEAELLAAIPGARTRLLEARGSGLALAFLSDMYLGSSFIRKQLERHDLCQPGDAVYVSCEMGCGKEDGRAFRLMAEKEGVSLEHVVHRGNDLRSDIRPARGVGAAAEPFSEGNLNRYEDILESHAYRTGGLASVMAGAARLARLSIDASGERERALRDVSASVGGPVISGYVLWLLSRAEEQGIRRLYFLARDGFILMRVAQILIRKLGLSCEARYLHGGRQAWYVPSIRDASPADLYWALDYAVPDRSLAAGLLDLGLTDQDVPGILAELESMAPPDRDADVSERLWAVIRRPRVRQAILERAAERRLEALRYLRQEGLLAGSDWAIVDIGWNGRLVRALDRILKDVGGEVPGALFFARHGTGEVNSAADGVPIHAFFSDHAKRLGQRGRINELLVEMFCGADEGPTLRYRSEGKRVIPVLASETNGDLVGWGLPVVHATIESFADHLWLDPDSLDLNADMRPAAADLLTAFLRSPTPAEARAWGAYPFEYGRKGSVSAPIATPLSFRHLAPLIRRGWISTRPGTEWTEGSLAISPRLTRLVLTSGVRMRKRLISYARLVRGADPGPPADQAPTPPPPPGPAP